MKRMTQLGTITGTEGTEALYLDMFPEMGDYAVHARLYTTKEALA